MNTTIQQQSDVPTGAYANQLFAGYPDLLTPKHISELTGISVQYVRTMCREGRLPAVLIGESRWYVPKTRFIAFVNGGGSE